MTRAWNDAIAHVIDVIGVLWFTILTLALAALIGAAWQFYPAWLPKRFWSRKRRAGKGTKRTKKRRRNRTAEKRGTKNEAQPTQVIADDALPDMSAAAFRTRADTYAAQGRFAEAVRERLRAIVRELVEDRVIPQHPDWTVTELARAAAAVRPALDVALADATTIFSDIWYGQRPATADHDTRMRAHDTAVHEILTRPVGADR